MSERTDVIGDLIDAIDRHSDMIADLIRTIDEIERRLARIERLAGIGASA